MLLSRYADTLRAIALIVRFILANHAKLSWPVRFTRMKSVEPVVLVAAKKMLSWEDAPVQCPDIHDLVFGPR